MRNFKFLILLCALSLACNNGKLPSTLGDPENSAPYGYQPLDPLPITGIFLKNDSSAYGSLDIKTRVMRALPCETVRLAEGKIETNGSIKFGTTKTGYAGSDYQIIIDYIKYDTKSVALKIIPNSSTDKNSSDLNFEPFESFYDSSLPDAVVPVYIGIGLRLTATINVKSGNIDLGNLFGLGVAAEAKKITGSLTIQTLGISGPNISPLIPIPSEINTTTIENAISALSSIKAKMFEPDVQVNPGVIGFYNNIGGGQKTVNKFISTFLLKKLPFPIP